MNPTPDDLAAARAVGEQSRIDHPVPAPTLARVAAIASRPSRRGDLHGTAATKAQRPVVVALTEPPATHRGPRPTRSPDQPPTAA